MKLRLALDWVWLQQQKEKDGRQWQAALRGVKLQEPASTTSDRGQNLMQARALGVRFHRIKVSKEEKARRLAELEKRR